MRQLLFLVAKAIQEDTMGAFGEIEEVLGGDSLGRMHGGVPKAGPS
jgi:hypothetical protein